MLHSCFFIIHSFVILNQISSSSASPPTTIKLRFPPTSKAWTTCTWVRPSGGWHSPADAFRWHPEIPFTHPVPPTHPISMHSTYSNSAITTITTATIMCQACLKNEKHLRTIRQTEPSSNRLPRCSTLKSGTRRCFKTITTITADLTCQQTRQLWYASQ